MFAPGQRIIHPDFGDITADVLEELAALARPQEPVIVEREQAMIAAAAGTLARDLSCGQLVAQVHPDSYDYWTQREGSGFWRDKGNLKKFLQDNPACAVKSESRGIRVHAGARRTRLATAGASGGLTRPGKGRFAT